jgi:hypothetical protein
MLPRPERKISDSILYPEVVRDPPREISRLMGGRDFFTDIGAMYIHRVGLLQGVGLALPSPGVKDGVNFATVTVNKENPNLFDLMLGTFVEESNWSPDTVEEMKHFKRLNRHEIRLTYERETVHWLEQSQQEEGIDDE